MTHGDLKFNADLKLGKERENTLAYVLAHDLDDWMEVKLDQKCIETDNVFIEFRQPFRDGRDGLKPSGISTSTADYWAFEYRLYNWLIVPTARLKHVVRQTHKERGSTFGGDGGKYEGVVVPIERLVLPEHLWKRRAVAA